MYIGDRFHPCNELFDAVVLLFVLVKLCAESLGEGFLFILLVLVYSLHLSKTIIGQFPRYVVLVNTHKEFVKLCNSLFGFFKLALFVGKLLFGFLHGFLLKLFYEQILI